MPFSGDQKSGCNSIATSVQSNTVPSFVKGDVTQFSKISVATYTTLTWKLAQQPALIIRADLDQQN